jgi:FkbM family methyltransferase
LVHSFEPNPLLYPYLNKNLKKIISNINLYNLALSDTNGETKLKLPLRSKSFFKTNIEELYQLGAASIHPNNQFDNFKEVIVKMRKLDDIKINNKIGFIKIDVEGHELEVIEGALNTIKENKPVLLIEIEERHSKRMVNDSIKYIKNIGYNCYYEKNKDLVRVEKLKNINEEFNFFFLPNITK